MSGHTPWREVKEKRMRAREGSLHRLRELVLEYEGFAEPDAWGAEGEEQAREAIIVEAKRLVDEYDTSDFPHHLIVKQAPDRDVYILWVMSADGPAGVFTRTELEAMGKAPAKLRRADETGSSQIPSEYGQSGAWDDKGFVVDGRWWLDRKHLEKYTRAYLIGADKAAKSYLRDCDDAEQAHGDESFDSLLAASSVGQDPIEFLNGEGGAQ